MSLSDANLARMTRASRLLVICDFDGVLATIVDRPQDARPLAGVLEALDAIAAIRQTDVAVISGRSLASLCSLATWPRSIRMVGGHGSEWDGAGPACLEPAEGSPLAGVRPALEQLAASAPGALLELKPHSLALHYRLVQPDRRDSLLARAQALAQAAGEFVVRHGKLVVEWCDKGADKGVALNRLRYETGATAVIFFGDDTTDEDAFRALGERDCGVAVGQEREGASHVLPDPASVAEALTRLESARREWSRQSLPNPIEHHSLLSDQRSVAFVNPRAAIVWMCVPRIDSPPLFGSLLGAGAQAGSGAPEGGEFSIGPSDGAEPIGQEYVGDSMVLRTRFPGFTVTDYMDCAGGRPFQRAGRTDLVRVIEGTGRVRIRFAPRVDFGRTASVLRTEENGLSLEGDRDGAVLYAPRVAWNLDTEGPHHTAVTEVELGAEPVTLELRYGTGNLRAPIQSETSRRAQTEKFWSNWSASLRTPSLAPQLVRRSALALKGLVHGPSGAIAAAASTSLPEWPGGVRNWDYRFCWPRDAALAAGALVRLGNTGHAMRLLDWFLSIIDHAGTPEAFRPTYSVTGQELGPEGEIGDLPGYGGSRPVRIGNAAAQQVQLDVFGPIVDLAWLLARVGAPLSPDHWRLVEAMVTAVERRWREPDNGIWEIRGPRRQYVHSKVMCWVAVDRAVRLADALHGRRAERWEQLRDQIASEVLERGWNENLGSFALAYDAPHLDAGSLMVGLSGLLPPTDARVLRTIESVDRGLRTGAAVFRYRFDDGLPGREGGFLICLGWLIESLALIGERSHAQDLFRDLVACAGPTGLMAEQHDPHTRLALGNFPQAYSHLALINAAVALDGST